MPQLGKFYPRMQDKPKPKQEQKPDLSALAESIKQSPQAIQGVGGMIGGQQPERDRELIEARKAISDFARMNMQGGNFARSEEEESTSDFFGLIPSTRQADLREKRDAILRQIMETPEEAGRLFPEEYLPDALPEPYSIGGLVQAPKKDRSKLDELVRKYSDLKSAGGQVPKIQFGMPVDPERKAKAQAEMAALKGKKPVSNEEAAKMYEKEKAFAAMGGGEKKQEEYKPKTSNAEVLAGMAPGENLLNIDQRPSPQLPKPEQPKQGDAGMSLDQILPRIDKKDPGIMDYITVILNAFNPRGSDPMKLADQLTRRSDSERRDLDRAKLALAAGKGQDPYTLQSRMMRDEMAQKRLDLSLLSREQSPIMSQIMSIGDMIENTKRDAFKLPEEKEREIESLNAQLQAALNEFQRLGQGRVQGFGQRPEPKK